MDFDLNLDLNSTPAEAPPASPDRGDAPGRMPGGRQWAENTRAAYVGELVQREETVEEESLVAVPMGDAIPEPLDFIQEVQMMSLETRINKYKLVEYGVRHYFSFLKVDRGFDTVIRLEPATIFPFVSYLRTELKLACNTSVKCCVALHYWAENCPKIIGGDGTDVDRIRDLKERMLYSQHHFERELGVLRPNKTTPLMLAPFLKMLRCLDITRVVDLRDNVLCVLAYYMGARARELTNLRYADIQILGAEQAVLINLRPFKNSAADGSSVSFQFGAKTEKELDLVFLIRQLGLYCGAYNADFSMTKDGGEMLVLATVIAEDVKTNEPLPSSYPTEIIKRLMKKCGLDPKHFALKSLRSGMASQLLLNLALLDGVGYIYNDWAVQYIEFAGHWQNSSCMRKTYISPVVDRARNNVAILFGKLLPEVVSSVRGVVESATHEKLNCPEDIVKDILGGNGQADTEPFWGVNKIRGKYTRVAEYNSEHKFGAEKNGLRAKKRKRQIIAASHPNPEIRRMSTSHATPEEKSKKKILQAKCDADNRRDLCALTSEIKGINPKNYHQDVLNWARQRTTAGDKPVKSAFGKYTKAVAELDEFVGTPKGRDKIKKKIAQKTRVLYANHTRSFQEQHTEMHDQNGNVMNRANPTLNLKYPKPVFNFVARHADRQDAVKCKLLASKIYWKSIPPRYLEYPKIVKTIQAEIPDYFLDVVIPWTEFPHEDAKIKEECQAVLEEYRKRDGEYSRARHQPKDGVGKRGPKLSSLQRRAINSALTTRSTYVRKMCNLHVEWLIQHHPAMFGQGEPSQKCSFVMATPEDPANTHTAENVGAPEGEAECQPQTPHPLPRKRLQTVSIDPGYEKVVVPDSIYNGGKSLGPYRSLVVAKRNYEQEYMLEERLKKARFPFIEPKKAPFHVVLSYFTASLAEMATDLRGMRTHANLYDIKFHQMSLTDQKAIIDKRLDKEEAVRADALIKKMGLLETASAKLYHHQSFLYFMGDLPHKVPFPASPESIKLFMWWMATDAVEPPKSWEDAKKRVWRESGPRMHTFTYVKDISGKLISYIREMEKVECQKKKFAKNGDVLSLQAVVAEELEQIKRNKVR